MKNILNLGESKDISSYSWEDARKELMQAVVMSQDPKELEQAIKLDVSDHIPIDIKSVMYERWIALAGRKSSILREYAWHLLLHGPDWDELAESLLREADSIDGQV